jgi:ankyrin repeat protein
MRRRFFLPPFVTLAVLLACALPGSSADLIAAIKAGDLARVQKLLAAGADPNSRDETGDPALVWAVSVRNAPIVNALLSKGADVHAMTNNAEKTARNAPLVWFAAGQGSAETLRPILQAGGSANARVDNGITPLMVAGFLGNIETIPVLLAAKADLEARDQKERTALMWAANGGRVEAVRLLLDAGAEVNAVGELESTPLMFAAQHGFNDVIALLVERGADLEKKSTPGLTALGFAKQNKLVQTIALLENGGRQKPPVGIFLQLRSFLYPEEPLETMFLRVPMKDEPREAIRQAAMKGDFRRAFDLQAKVPNGSPLTLAYLQMQLGDRAGALASLRKLIAIPGMGSREILRAWKLIRDLGEAPPADLAQRVLGVVVESGLGPQVLDVAAYADGQPRFFLSSGGGILGEDRSAEEKAKDLEVVRLAQELVKGMEPAATRKLPGPGRIRFTFLTPSGSYVAETSFVKDQQGPYREIFSTIDDLGLLYKKSVAAQAAKKP